MAISSSVGSQIFNIRSTSIEDRVVAFKKKYPNRYVLKRGAAHWTAGNRSNPGNWDLEHYDCLIDYNLNVYLNNVAPLVTKAHTWMRNSLNYGISLAGMAGTNSNLWQKIRLQDTKHPQMVSKDQFEAMCFMFALVSVHFYIPLAEIKTHEEYAREAYPGYPNGYFPDRWDLMGLGPEMRSKIKWYIEQIKKVY